MLSDGLKAKVLVSGFDGFKYHSVLFLDTVQKGFIIKYTLSGLVQITLVGSQDLSQKSAP